jgi:adenylosuccinate lyase
MRANANALHGLMLSEAVMFALGEKVGRQTAHDVVYSCAMRAIDEGASFGDLLMSDPRVATHLSRQDLDRLLDPTRYVGLAGEMVDRVLADPGPGPS